MEQNDKEQARVIAVFGRRMVLMVCNRTEVPARVKGRKLQPVCGDRVEAAPLPNETDWLITDILPRHNELTRPNMRGKVEVLAANLDAVVVVAAALPVPDWFVVDRYLCAAELMGAEAAIVFNKIDLGDIEESAAAALADFSRTGYAVFRCSARQNPGVAPLLDFLAGHTAIIVGQSGVGKSTLINALTGKNALRTAGISESTGEGRHTTVNSVMLPLANGGAVIDSPGVRDYAPAITRTTDVVRGFREICAAGSRCRFANCRHLREPDCSVKLAVANGDIGARRYESYKRLLAATERLAGH